MKLDILERLALAGDIQSYKFESTEDSIYNIKDKLTLTFKSGKALVIDTVTSNNETILIITEKR